VETGLYYNSFRYYDPEDPIRLTGGSLNLHCYIKDSNWYIDFFGLTGTYIFQFNNGDIYIGKGPIDRSLTSQNVRANQIGSSTSNITKGAHVDFGDNVKGFMVEAELMERNNFGSNAKLLNAKNSPGKKLLADLKKNNPTEYAKIQKLADKVEKDFKASKGKICK
jgi:uncharacterized protein RhaS with RHS repeats